MSEPTLSDMMRRVDRLERENRRWRACAIVGGLLIGAMMLMGQTAPRAAARVVEAERFVLRGPGGTVRAALEVLNGTAPEGPVRLALFHPGGRIHLELAQRPYQPSGLRIFGSEGAELVDLSEDNNSAQLSFPVRDEDEGVALGVRRGKAGLIFAKGPKVIWKAP